MRPYRVQQTTGCQSNIERIDRTPARGVATFNRSAGESNQLTLVFGRSAGAFFINGRLASELDLSLPAAMAAGDVRVITGLFSTDELSGATTSFTQFAIYSGD